MAKLNLKKIRAKAEEIKAKEKARKEGKGNSDSAFVNTLPVGTIELRLLPPWSPAGDLAKEIYTHFKLPPGTTTVVDVEKTYPKLRLPNPINEVLEEFKDHLDVTRLWSKPTPKINVYFPDSEINEECEKLDKSLIGKVKILSPSVGAYNQIVKIISNPRIGDITDPHNGYSITIEKTVGATWQETRYDVQYIPPQGPLVEDEEELNEILEKTWDLDKMFPAPDDAKIAEIHTVAKALRKHLEKQVRQMGGVVVSKRSSVRHTDDDELVEDEEEEVEDEVEEEEEADDADAESEEDEAEEEEPEPEPEPKPKKKKASTKASKKKTAKKSSTSKKASGKKKPECFGDADVFKIDDEQYETCDSCLWEIPCAQAQKKAGTFCYVED